MSKEDVIVIATDGMWDVVTNKVRLKVEVIKYKFTMPKVEVIKKRKVYKLKVRVKKYKFTMQKVEVIKYKFTKLNRVKKSLIKVKIIKYKETF